MSAVRLVEEIVMQIGWKNLRIEEERCKKKKWLSLKVVEWNGMRGAVPVRELGGRRCAVKNTVAVAVGVLHNI